MFAEAYNWEEVTSEIPLNVAIEHKIKKLTTRLGLSRPIIESRKTTVNNPNDTDVPIDGVFDQTDTETTTVDPQTQTQLSLGLGIAIAEYLTLDAHLQQDVLFTGTYLLSGIANTMAAQASIVYKF